MYAEILHNNDEKCPETDGHAPIQGAPSMFLSPDDLYQLTDYIRPADQRRWLREHGFAHEVGSSGRPKVLPAEVERHLLGGGTSNRARLASEPKLKLDALPRGD